MFIAYTMYLYTTYCMYLGKQSSNNFALKAGITRLMWDKEEFVLYFTLCLASFHLVPSKLQYHASVVDEP